MGINYISVAEGDEAYEYIGKNCITSNENFKLSSYNTEEIVSMNNHELELLSYDKDYDEIFFSASKDYLESLTNKNLKYCYSEYEKEEVINLCQKLKLHTIIPTLTINKSLFKEIKEKLTNSAIISIPISENTKIPHGAHYKLTGAWLYGI